jgi:hypothetical protein
MTGHPAGDCVGTRSIVYLRLVIAVCVYVCLRNTFGRTATVSTWRSR